MTPHFLWTLPLLAERRGSLDLHIANFFTDTAILHTERALFLLLLY